MNSDPSSSKVLVSRLENECRTLILLQVYHLLETVLHRLLTKAKSLSSLWMHYFKSFLTNRVDPDQPVSSEAGWSGSTLFTMQFMLHLNLSSHAKNSK